MEILSNLLVGDQHLAIPENAFVIQAAKEFHRLALDYKGHLDKRHPNYLKVEEPNRLILNLVDTPNIKYVNKDLVWQAVDAITQNIHRPVVVQCWQGRSRSPTIALLWMLKYTFLFKGNDDPAAWFRQRYYPMYAPSMGWYEFLIQEAANLRVI